jgi:arylformamidase
MSLVYRDFDVAAVHSEYLPSLRVPNFMDVLRDWALRGEIARDSLPTERLQYGAHPDEWLWYTPATTIGAPLVVFIHGGYWHLLSADDGSFLAPAAVQAGCAFASVNYTLCPDASIPTLVDQVRRAVERLLAPSDLPHDRSAVHLVGHSAGAHLAASIADVQFGVAGYVFMSGVFDIRPLLHTPDNDDIRLTVDDAERWSPLLHPSLIGDAAVLVAWGADESSEFARQSQEWADKIEAPVVISPSRNHFDVLYDLLDPATELGAAVLGQIAAIGRT